MIYRKAALTDVSPWLDQMENIKDHFPGYEREDFQSELITRIKDGEAFAVESNGQLAGGILFSRKEREILFLAVFKPYRKRGIGRTMVQKVLGIFHEGEEISVITYREGDPIGEIARVFYRTLGFEEKELLDVFDYPCQRFSYRIK